MQSSKIIEFDGVFIGAAVRLPEAQGWRFVSADRRTSEADGCTAATLYDTQMLARRAFVTARRQEPALAITGAGTAFIDTQRSHVTRTAPL